MADGKDKKDKGKGKGAKGARSNLASALKALGVKNVTPALINAARDLTGAQDTIEFLRKPSEEEIYYGNAVRRLKSDAEIEAEQRGAYERTRSIAQDTAISMPALTNSFTSALGGLAGSLSAYGGGDARATMGIESAGQSAAGGVVSAAGEARGISASVADLIAANADVFAARAKQARDEKREELFEKKRMATSARQKALVAARAGAQSGLLSNLTTLLGLAPSGGGGYGGGYGGGGGRGGSGGDDSYFTSGLTGNYTTDQLAAGTAYEGFMSKPSNESNTNSTASEDTSGPTSGYNVAAAGNVGPSINAAPSWKPGSGQSYSDWQAEQRRRRRPTQPTGARPVTR